MSCFLFGAGPLPALPLRPRAGDTVIAVDGGLSHLAAYGIAPDLILGDFDSAALPVDPSCPTLRFPVRKDETDMQLAISEGLKRGEKHFLLLGGTGGRFDHTLANIACLAHLAHLGARGWLFGEDTVMTVLKNDTLALPSELPLPLPAGSAAVFALEGDAEGVTLRGFDYEAEGITLRPHIPTGVSNRYLGGEGQIAVSCGLLLVLLPLPSDSNEGEPL